jgi:hypothetical protein
VSKTSVCGSWGAITGEIRYFADKLGIPRASIEGTQIPMDVVHRYARSGKPELVFEPERKRSPLALKRRVEYFGFDLGRELESIDEFPSELRDESRRLIAEALARGEARHAALKRNQPLIDEIRETWRRSGGKSPKLGQRELASLYESRLRDVNSMSDFRHTNLDLASDLEQLVPADVRGPYRALPDHVSVRDRDVEIQYDVEEKPEGNIGIARLRLPEKLARTLTEIELPKLDRPLRFLVTRGARGAARAATLDALQEELERPFTNEELEAMNRDWETHREERRERRRRQRGGRSETEDRNGARRRRRRPGRRERTAQRGERTDQVPNESSVEQERRRGPRGRRGPR